MKRKLWLVNLLLLGLVIAAGAELQKRWQEARDRELRLLKERVPTPPAPELSPIAPVQPVSAASYIDVANKVLLAKDRNPNVIVEVKPPPPPKVMPELPKQYGVIDFGQGPTVVLAEKPGEKQKGYRPGDKIGPFKLLAVNNTHILFEWEDKRVMKRLDELVDKSAATAAAAPPTQAAKPATPPAAAPTVVAPVAAAPGASMGGELKACLPGDNSPSGTVANGMKKVVTATPFGSQCRWEPVK